MPHFTVSAFSDPIYATSNVNITSPDPHEVIDIALHLNKKGEILSWKINNEILNAPIRTTFQKVMRTQIADDVWNVAFITESSEPYSITSITAKDMSEAEQIFKDANVVWYWKGYPLDSKFKVSKLAIHNSRSRFIPSITSDSLDGMIVGVPFDIKNIRIYYTIGNSVIGCQGEISTPYDSPATLDANGYADLTFTPTKSGPQKLPIIYYGYADDIIDTPAAVYPLDIDPVPGSPSLFISTPSTTLMPGQLFPITVTFAQSYHSFDFSIKSFSGSGTATLGRFFKPANISEITIMCSYSALYTWDVNQDLFAETESNDDYAPNVSNYISLTVS